MQRDDAWELRPGDNGPETAAPDATSARRFVDELVKYTGHGNEAAGVKMKTLAMHLLNEQGWENVRDIRESLTATMLSTAMAQLEVGAGYAKQFQKYLGGPDGPWEAKKPKSLKNERESEPTRQAKAMKFDEIAETSSGAGAVGAEVLQCLVVPPDVFDGVFGENIHVEFPYQHALKRAKQTEVVNRYVMYTIFQLGYVAVGGVLLQALARDFKSKFPLLCMWGGKARDHVGVLQRGFRNRRSAKEGTYKGLKISKSDMDSSSEFAQNLVQAGFPLDVVETGDALFSVNRKIEVAATMVDEVDAPPLTPTRNRLWHCALAWLSDLPPPPIAGRREREQPRGDDRRSWAEQVGALTWHGPCHEWWHFEFQRVEPEGGRRRRRPRGLRRRRL